MTDWYYADATNQRQGPLSAEALATLHAQGGLRPETLVWREGLAAWTPWRQVMHEVVSPTVAAGAPPVPPPATSDDASPYAPPRAALHDEGAVVAGGHVVLAGFWKRVAASIIDSFVTSMAMWMLMIPLFMVIGGGIEAMARVNDGSNVLVTVLYYLISIAIPMVYLAWMHSSSSQATLGKMAVGIKVVRTDGERISFLRGIGRYWGYLLSSMLLMIGLIMAAFTERKQALHDFMCDTLVVDKHAFTSRPDLQRDELGSVAIAVLVLAGLFVVGMFALIAIGIAALAAGGWR
ncbi:MAG TPA: RDD family protein [Patescibacteria group bacterium]|nr:RDD family protein [Patescibacteria group bacterium]